MLMGPGVCCTQDGKVKKSDRGLRGYQNISSTKFWFSWTEGQKKGVVVPEVRGRSHHGKARTRWACLAGPGPWRNCSWGSGGCLRQESEEEIPWLLSSSFQYVFRVSNPTRSQLTWEPLTSSLRDQNFPTLSLPRANDDPNMALRANRLITPVN